MKPYKVLDNMNASKKVQTVKFSLSTPDDILKYTVCDLSSTEGFESDNRPKYGGLFDLRMGTITKTFDCLTCKQSVNFCPGHFGRIELAKKVYWSHYITTIIHILQIVCTDCKQILDDSCRKYINVKNNKKIS